MAALKTRLDRLEKEYRFHRWLETEDTLSRLTEDELYAYATTGKLPESVWDRPSMSRLNRLDRKALLRLWEEDERFFAGRGEGELDFYSQHGYWPEQAQKTVEGESSAST